MNKSIFKSKTVWGIILGILTAILTAFHINFTVPGGDPATSAAVQSLISVGFLIFGIYGRVKAEVSASKMPWYKSKTIWSIVATAVMIVLNYFHISLPITELIPDLPKDQATLDAGGSLTALIPSIMAIISRVKADTSIGK